MPSPRRTATRWLTSRRAGRWARRALPFTLLTLAFTTISLSAFAASNDVPDTGAGQSVPALPGSPAIVSVGSADGELDVVFDPPGNEPTANITTYQYSTDNGLTWKARATGTTASPLAITTVSGGAAGLVNGTQYSVRIRAVNAIGTGPVSNQVNATPYTVPDAPTSVTGSEGDQQIAVAWQAPLDNGGSAVTGYRVQIRTAPSGAWGDPGGTCAFAVTGSSTALSCDATGLTNGTAYNVRVAAVNAGGTGASSDPTGDVTPMAPTPGAPTGVSAVAGNQQATVSWTAPTGTSNPITGYTVTSSPGGLTCTTNGALSCVVTGLTNGTAYTFTVVAGSAGGDGPASNPSAAVTPYTTPDAPTALSATPGEQDMTLAWTAPASNGGVALTDYTVQYRVLNAPTWSTFADGTSTATTATVTGLTVGTTYEFRVAAVNTAGTGSYTAAVTGDGSTAWGPEDLSGGVDLWLDADDAATFTLSGSTVSQWNDKSGHLRHAGQATVANQPARTASVMNSRAAVVFDGTNDSLPFDGSFVVNSDYSAAVAVARSSNQSANYFLAGTTWADNQMLSLGWRFNTSLTHAQFNNDYDMTVSGYSGSPTNQVMTFRHSTTGGKSTWIDGGTSGLAASGTSGSTTSLSGWGGSSVGRLSNNYFNGRVGEIVMMASALSTTDRQKLEGYLAWKWGTTSLLPSNHPYKTLPSYTSTPATDPGTPTSLAATADDQSAVLTWTAPASNGGSAVADYLVQYKASSSGTWLTFADGATSTTGATVTGLTNGTAYDFQVAAVNAVGTGTATASTSTTPVTTPGAPTALAGTAGNTQVALTWTAPASTGGSAITDSVVQYKVSGAASWSTFADGTSTTTSATVTGLTNGTTYVFQVAATNSAGTGTYSSSATATTPSAPGAPTALAGTAGNTQVALTWTAPASNGGAAITDYVVQYKASSSGTWLTFADGTSTTTSATVTGLTNGTAYDFQVAATNTAGTSSYSTSTSVTPYTTPGAPTALAGTAGNTQVALTWTAPASTGGSAITDYVVQYKVNGAASFSTFADGTSTATSATVTGLSNNTTYVFQVAAVNAAGTGTYSATVNVTTDTTPGAPTGLTATAGEQTMSLSWTAPASDGGATITDYVVQYRVTGAGSWSTFADGTSSSTTATVTGLTVGTSYDFQVAATNSIGTGSYSSTATGAGSTAWGPEDLSGGLALWYDADDASTFSYSSGSVVSQWNDKSGNSRHATQGTVANQPTRTASLMNSRAGVVFNGTSSFLNYTGSFLANTNYTIAAAVARTSNKSGNYFMAGSTQTTNNNLHLGWVSDTSFSHRQYGNDYNMTVAGYSSTATQLSVFQHSSTAGKNTWVDGGTSLLAASGSSASTTPLAAYAGSTLGYWSQSPSYFAGRIGEIVIATSALSDSDRQKVEGYLAWEWGTTSSLPSAHPYKSVPPYTSSPNTVSGVPTALAATGASGQVALTWTAPASTGGTPIADYIVQYRLSGAGSWSTFSDGVSTTASATVTGLVAGSTYDFQVAAVNAVGTSTYSSSVSKIAATTAGAPTALTRGTKTATTQALTWTAPASNGGSAVTDYVVQYRVIGSSTWLTFADGTSTAASATVTGLTDATDYEYQVAATNGAGTGSYSTSLSVYYWTPGYLSTLAAWFDADNTADFTLSGTSVSSWASRGGSVSSLTVSQTLATNKPVRTASVMGGKSAVVFDGTNDFLTFSNTTFLNSSDFTIGSAVARYSNKSWNAYLGGTAGTNGMNVLFGWSNGARLSISVYGGGAHSLDMTVPAWSATTDEVHTGSISNAGYGVYQQGGTLSATNTNTNRSSGWAGAALGRSYDKDPVTAGTSTGYFYGRIGEIVIAKSVLSTADRQALEGYLAWKWGTTSALPAAHPYKSTQPTSNTP